MDDYQRRDPATTWPLKGAYGRKLTAGERPTKITFHITISDEIKGIPLDAPADWKTTLTFSGPEGTEYTDNEHFATHRYISAIAYGSVTKYTYAVTDERTGVYLREETHTYLTDTSIKTYLNLGTYIASSDQLILQNDNRDDFIVMKESDWIKHINSYDALDYLHW